MPAFHNAATMDIVDRDMEEAEMQATRTWSRDSKERRERERAEQAEKEREQMAPLERHETDASTLSSSSSSSSSIDMGRIATAGGGSANVARTRTQGGVHPIEIHRTQTHRLQHVGTVGASIRSRTQTKPLPEFGGGKPYPPDLPEREEYVVEFDGKDDPLHPQNWPFKKKFTTGAILAYTCLCSSFTSSVFSASTQAISPIFGVSVEVTTLTTSLFVLGYAFGPLVWGPFSELQGRHLPILIGMFGFMLFNFACATAENLQTLMICRFFTGVFGSCPLAIVAAVFADIFDNTQRGVAIVIFSSMVFMGPMLGPFIGGFIQASYLGWRWNLYLPGIMAALALGLNIFFVEESYAPIVLVSKASELRRRTKNWGIHAKQEEVEVDFKELITKNFSRPIRLLITEPIILLITIYMSFIYGLLYLFLTAYPLVFSGVHHIKPGVSGLPFFGMVVGIFFVAGLIIWDNKSYNKKLAANGGIPVPEWRLPFVILGGALFAVGLFWFGWTGYTDSIHWIVPTLSGLLTGFGLLAIFIQLFNYIIDSYLMFAASAIAANTFLRSITAAGFPLFARQMFNGLGIQWAGTLLGCFAALLVPIPICFYLFGKKLRAKSKFAPTMKPKKPDDEETGSTTEEDNDDSHGNMSALHASKSRVHHGEHDETLDRETTANTFANSTGGGGGGVNGVKTNGSSASGPTNGLNEKKE